MNGELQHRVEQLESKMPGVARLLRNGRVFRCHDLSIVSELTDLGYVELPKYHVAAAKWCDIERIDEIAISGLTEWVTIYFASKTDLNRIQTRDGNRIKTRDIFHQEKSSTEDWDYYFVELEKLGDQKVAAYWTNLHGERGPRMEVEIK